MILRLSKLQQQGCLNGSSIPGNWEGDAGQEFKIRILQTKIGLDQLTTEKTKYIMVHNQK